MNEDLIIYRGAPTSLDKFAAKLSYNWLVDIMSLIFDFVPPSEGRKTIQNRIHHAGYTGIQGD